MSSAWIDCTHTIESTMLMWPGDPPPAFTHLRSQANGDRTTTTAVSLSAHSGTHVDAPRHLILDGMSVEALPLDVLCGPAWVADVEAGHGVSAADVDGLPAGNVQRVLWRTGAYRAWQTGHFDPAFPALSVEAAQRLMDRCVRLVGIDSFSMDPYDLHDLPAHRILLGAGLIVLENLDLSQVAPGPYELIALPLKLAASDGAPARVIVRPA
jgi:arylformamidase